jgi:hypothetical protein
VLVRDARNIPFGGAARKVWMWPPGDGAVPWWRAARLAGGGMRATSISESPDEIDPDVKDVTET